MKRNRLHILNQPLSNILHENASSSHVMKALLASSDLQIMLILNSTVRKITSVLVRVLNFKPLIVDDTMAAMIDRFRRVSIVKLAKCSRITNESIFSLVRLQFLKTLDLSVTHVTDVSALGSCSSLHTLDLSDTEVMDVSGLESCISLHTLNLRRTQVMDVSGLGNHINVHGM